VNDGGNNQKLKYLNVEKPYQQNQSLMAKINTKTTNHGRHNHRKNHYKSMSSNYYI
jgi:hypothetical protein